MTGRTSEEGGHPDNVPAESSHQTPLFETVRDQPQSGFAFETFERSEAQAAEDASYEPLTEDEPTDEGPKNRVITRRAFLPPGDVVVDTRPVGGMTVVTMRGRINESFGGPELGRSLTGEVLFDLSEVDRVSSFGVKGWLQMLDAARMTRCVFYRCSEAVINQVTMMRNFCGPGQIHSLQVPYTCGACGEEFGAVYDAVEDRERLLGRSPAPVGCPNCGQAAEMDDDPWAYFALDEHLLPQVPEGLEQVLDHLTSTNRVDPIEKYISDAETRLRFNAPLDAKLRLRRAFAGLEGRVTLDLSVCDQVQQAGLDRLVSAAYELKDEVQEWWLDGAPASLVQAFLRSDLTNVYVATMFVQGSCPANGIQREVLIDVERHRPTLLARQLPPVQAAWASGPLDLADTDLVFLAAHRTPTSTQSQAITGTPAPTVAVPAAAPPPPADRSNIRLLQGLAVLAVLAVLATTLAFVAILLVYGPQRIAAVERGTIGSPLLETSVAVAEGWDGGDPLPPPWVEQPFAMSDDEVRFVGIATGSDVTTVGEDSRAAALGEISRQLRQTLSDQGSAGVFADPAPTTQDAVLADRLLSDVGAWATPERVASAVKREGDSLTVATQHRLTREQWDAIIAYYSTEYSFRGFGVVRRFPSEYGESPAQSTPIMVSRVESWFRQVRAADGVQGINQQPVTALDEFESRITSAFSGLDGGDELTVQVFHDGELASVGFTKPKAAPKPKPTFDLLPLEDP